MTARRCAALLLVVGFGAVAAASAEPLASGNGNGTKAQPAPYEDRLIDGGSLAPDRFGGDASSAYNAEGWPRYWRIEGVASYFDQQGQVTRENGLRLSAAIDTPNYGALSIDATARVRPGSFIGTIVQRGLAFDNDWRANNSIGITTTLGIDLARSQYRFFIPPHQEMFFCDRFL